MISQEQLFYQEQRNIAAGDRQFLDLVNDGLTREDLDACIKRRPSLWSRFAAYRDLLPASASVPDSRCANAMTQSAIRS